MKKLIAAAVIFFGGSIALLVLFLSPPGGNPAKASSYYKGPSTSTYNSDTGYMFDYKIDSEGELVSLKIDKKLTIEEILYYHPDISDGGNVSLAPGVDLTQPGCSDSVSGNFNFITDVPLNIKFEGLTYIFNNADCEYKYANKSNAPELGRRTIKLTEFVNPSNNYLIEHNGVDDFIEHTKLPTTYTQAGIYISDIDERNDFELTQIDFTKYVSLYENALITYQDYLVAIKKLDELATLEQLVLDGEDEERIPLVDEIETAILEFLDIVATKAPEISEDEE